MNHIFLKKRPGKLLSPGLIKIFKLKIPNPNIGKLEFGISYLEFFF
jgi:hypothetical protein